MEPPSLECLMIKVAASFGSHYFRLGPARASKVTTMYIFGCAVIINTMQRARRFNGVYSRRRVHILRSGRLLTDGVQELGSRSLPFLNQGEQSLIIRAVATGRCSGSSLPHAGNPSPAH